MVLSLTNKKRLRGSTNNEIPCVYELKKAQQALFIAKPLKYVNKDLCAAENQEVKNKKFSGLCGVLKGYTNSKLFLSEMKVIPHPTPIRILGQK